MRSLRSPPLLAGALVMVLGLILTVAMASRGGWDQFIGNDALHFHAVALDLDASEVTAGDPAYRYGRIGLPLLAWILSAGGSGSVVAAQMLVTPIAVGLLVAGATAIAGRTSGRWFHGLAVLAVPGLWVSFRYAWADTLLAAFVIGSISATLGRRRLPCLAAIAAASLTKEAGVICAIPAAAESLRTGDLRGAIERLGAIGPAVLWWAWVRVQSGEWPFLADAPSRADAIAWPGVDIAHALTGGRGAAAAATLALVVGVVGIALVVRHRTQTLAWSAGTWGLLTLCLGENVLTYPGDAARVMTPAMCVIALGAVTLTRASQGAAELRRTTLAAT